MLDDNIKKAIVQAFEMQHFDTGTHFYNHPERKELRIYSIWVVELSMHFAGTVWMAGIRCLPYGEAGGWYRGLLLVPPLWEPRDRAFGGKEPLRVVNLTWLDPVTLVLQFINIFPQETWAGGENSQNYSLHTLIGPITGSFKHSGQATDPKLNNLYDAILTTVELLSDAYNDEEIRAFLNFPPFIH